MIRIILPILVAAIITPEDAHAYLDPGSGSQMLQIIIGFVLGGLFALKIFWKKIFSVLRDIFKSSKK